ncbi:DesA family fatty acid desaturase [Brachymonas denitrificans]|mgnify:CR=1 FL=1|jgi:stearoyl-CoA desaturase (delta-9 desaturase)|uniref:Stearoyl-CoA desaturase (Delta-9 desaturase) n=1 Tax=Brachymonas denitrificans DSM 15123 TaxID=1121117 RepID=A0A1H8EZC1_9BURK|nr:fatty acid desaturase [Brachymonas denitrificans]SEN24833.1 stearoyl-CoA desaturase (delta-9 desaturase) [Brachymonas denitrificans DSM 15123]
MDKLLDIVANGLLHASWWQMILVVLAVTHVTIASVTIFLHRHQAHRSLELHALPSHFFRFWLWLTTGMVTKEWTAVHRKHHAKCEQAEDPHSPQVYGIRKVLLEGVELYRAEAANQETLERYGHNTPDDWLERHVYSRHTVLGVSLLLMAYLLLFGVAGLSMWAVTMLWIPVTAAGIINGLGHYWGYRNFEAQDASTNISPWGIIIGGEELHNNHHTYPTSAKLSVKPFEFDIGWMYIRILARLGLARVKKTAPRAHYGSVKPVADEQTLQALIANRYELMADYARQVRAACSAEIQALKQRQADFSAMRLARRWLPRDSEKVPASVQPQLAATRAAYPVLDSMIAMREELRQLWANQSLSREQMLQQLQAWCQRAEASGIAALRDFALRLRAVQA